MDKKEDKAQAQLLQLREGAGKQKWKHLVVNNQHQIERRENLLGVIYWYPAGRMPIDLFSYIREASNCFAIAQFLASITMASCAIELILNRDRRTRSTAELRRINGWATLNNHNLATADKLGLPVTSLCSDGESTQSKSSIVFVNRRNKAAHGEILQMITTLSDYDSGAEKEALDQVIKAQKFVADWFNTAPDVQDGHIDGHKWPTINE